MERWYARAVVVSLGLAGCTTTALDSDATDTAAGDSTDAASTGTTGATEGASGQCEDAGWNFDGGGDEAGDDTGLGMGDDMPLPITIEQAQRGDATPMTWVALEGVVITTPSAQSEVITGRELFVQDPAGGAYSGLRVVSVTFDLGQLAAPADAVDLVGQLVDDGEGFVLLRVDIEERVTIRGAAVAITPTPASLAQLDPTNPEARAFEGVIVELVDATVTDDAACAGELIVDDTLRIDDRFVPGHLAAFAVGAQLAAVRGVLVRASGSYELAPPAADAIE